MWKKEETENAWTKGENRWPYTWSTVKRMRGWKIYGLAVRDRCSYRSAPLKAFYTVRSKGYLMYSRRTDLQLASRLITRRNTRILFSHARSSLSAVPRSTGQPIHLLWSSFETMDRRANESRTIIPRFVNLYSPTTGPARITVCRDESIVDSDLLSTEIRACVL